MTFLLALLAAGPVLSPTSLSVLIQFMHAQICFNDAVHQGGGAGHTSVLKSQPTDARVDLLDKAAYVSNTCRKLWVIRFSPQLLLRLGICSVVTLARAQFSEPTITTTAVTSLYFFSWVRLHAPPLHVRSPFSCPAVHRAALQSNGQKTIQTLRALN